MGMPRAGMIRAVKAMCAAVSTSMVMRHIKVFEGAFRELAHGYELRDLGRWCVLCFAFCILELDRRSRTR